MKRLGTCLALAGLLVLTTGCSFYKRVSEHSIRYNHAVEKAHNELLLLNILRARDRFPMHFTAISQVKGTISTTFGSPAEGTIGGGSPDVTLTPGGNYTSSPTFDVAVLDSESFMRGFLTPVSLEIVQYYLDQGWPVDLLFYLLVEKIETLPEAFSAKEVAQVPKPSDSEPEVLRYRGGTEDQEKLFGKFVAHIASEDSVIDIRQESLPVGPPIDATKLNSLGDLLKAGESKLKLEATDDSGTQYQLKKPGAFFIEFKDKAGNPSALHDQGTFSKKGDQTKRSKEVGKVTLRSPQGVLYFLGELAREMAGDPNAGPRLPGGERLFVVREGSGDGEAGAAITAEFQGRTYHIPNNGTLDASDPAAPAGRSLQCIALVAQLIALQKDATELPRTGTVTVVGG